MLILENTWKLFRDIAALKLALSVSSLGVLGALLSLHSGCRTVKFRASKVEIIHVTAPTPGAVAARGFDPQLSQTVAHCFSSVSYLPIPSTACFKGIVGLCP